MSMIKTGTRSHFAGETVMGKHYIDDDRGKVLVTKAGAGTLAVDEAALRLNEANPLPAVD